MIGHPIHNSFRKVTLDQILHDIDDKEVERNIEEKKSIGVWFLLR